MRFEQDTMSKTRRAYRDNFCLVPESQDDYRLIEEVLDLAVGTTPSWKAVMGKVTVLSDKRKVLRPELDTHEIPNRTMTPEETKLFIGYLGSFMVDAHKAEQELSPERLLMISLIEQTLDGYQHALDQEEAQQDPSPSSQNPIG